MIITFSSIAWEDYTRWQKEDPKKVLKINKLIKDVSRNGNAGIGKPEALKFDLTGFWSRRIDHEHRLVYKLTEDELQIISCRYHY